MILSLPFVNPRMEDFSLKLHIDNLARRQRVGLSELSELNLRYKCEFLSDSLCQLFPSLLGLESLRLGDNRLVDADVQRISVALTCLQNLSTLDFANNNVEHAGVSALCSVVPAIPSLRILVLKNNKILGRGAEIIAANMSSLSQLRCLDLGGNRIGREGSFCIGKALVTCAARGVEMRFNFRFHLCIGF